MSNNEDAGEVDAFRSRMIAGDQQALAELFAQERQRLWRVAHFRTDAKLSARLDPDDVLQDAFLDASRRLHHYCEQSEFSPFVWLRMIVAQTLADTHRRHLGAQQRDAGREVHFQQKAEPPSTIISIANFLLGHFTSPSMAAIKSEQSDKIRAAVDDMEALDREVLALRHFEELTNSEVAEVLHITQKTASIRYVRAIARLKEMLDTMPEFADLLFPKQT